MPEITKSFYSALTVSKFNLTLLFQLQISRIQLFFFSFYFTIVFTTPSKSRCQHSSVSLICWQCRNCLNILSWIHVNQKLDSSVVGRLKKYRKLLVRTCQIGWSNVCISVMPQKNCLILRVVKSRVGSICCYRLQTQQSIVLVLKEIMIGIKLVGLGRMFFLVTHSHGQGCLDFGSI